MSMPVSPENPGVRLRWLLWVGFLLLLLASFAVSLAAHAPARWLVQRFELDVPQNAASGTLMHGQIALDGGFALRWDVLPWASLTGLRLNADLALTGPGTDIGGRLAAGLSAYRLGPVDGQADARVLGAIFPGVQVRCTGPVLAAGLWVEVTRQSLDGAGTLRSDSLICGSAQVPPMALGFAPLASGTTATITAGMLPLLTVTAAGDGRVALVLHKEGAAPIPGLPSSADSSIDLPLSSFFP